MSDFRLEVLKAHELIRLTNRASKFKSSLLAKNTEVENKSVILEDKTGELEATNEAITVSVAHIFVANDYVVLRRHIVGQIVIHDQAQQSIQQRWIHLLVNLVHFGLE